MTSARLLKFVLFNFFLVVCCSECIFSQTFDSVINRDSIRSYVEFLASDSLKGRLAGSEGATIAGEFIQNKFRSAGLQPIDSGRFLVPFNTHSLGITNNIVGVLPGNEKSSEIVIFSAHYDHIGTAATNPYKDEQKISARRGDSIYNGANDNASGTAALISLAYYYARLGNNKRTIIFVAFSGEELGMLGSSYMASKIKSPNSITCMINLEMLGRGNKPFITGSELGNLRYLLNKELRTIDKERFGRNYFDPDYHTNQRLFTRSDNFPFAQFRIPAYTVMVTNSEDQFYHSLEDEPSTLNYELVERVTQAVALAMNACVEGRFTPSRIDVPALE